MFDISIDSKREINGQPKGRPRPFAKRISLQIKYPRDLHLNMHKILNWEANSIAFNANREVQTETQQKHA